jgi:hypothetical protein
VHRFLREICRYFADLGRSTIEAWDRFFFAPANPTTLGLLRIIFGALLFWDMAVLGLDLRDYLGSDGWIGPAAVRQYLNESVPGAWSFWLYIPDAWLPVAWVGCLVVVALFTIGFASRWTAVLAWLVSLSTVRRAPVALFGFDYMIATWTFYLAAFGASGQSLSLDRYRAVRRATRSSRSLDDRVTAPPSTVSANLSLRMIQLHLCLIYGSAGLSKLMAPEWWDGTAVEMILITPEFRRFNLVWLAAYPSLLNLATHGSLFLEATYPVFIWVRKLRPLIIASMILLHLGIDLILGLTEFGLTMIAANFAFINGAWLRDLARGPRQFSLSESHSLRNGSTSPRKKVRTDTRKRGIVRTEVD